MRPVAAHLIDKKAGPHFFVGTPLYKTPRDPYTSNQSYDVIDLVHASDDYIPRTLYKPSVPADEYRRRSPKVPWSGGPPVTDFYRFVVFCF